MDILQAALRYINRGVAVVPIWRDKRKNPHLSTITEFFYRLPTAYDWRRWVNRWPACNIGLITGYWGLCALDFDTVEAYQAWCDGPGRGVKGQTWTVATARGYHVWFQVDGDPGDSRSFVYENHEVLLRAKGQYCIVPPSIHHSGAHYRTVHRVEPWQVSDLQHYLREWEPKPTKKPEIRPVFPLAASFATRIEDLIPIPEGAKPNARGAYKVRCPFHDDQTPSAWLNVGQQRFGCNLCWPALWFDVANLISMQEGISNKEAFLKLKQPVN